MLPVSLCERQSANGRANWDKRLAPAGNVRKMPAKRDQMKAVSHSPGELLASLQAQAGEELGKIPGAVFGLVAEDFEGVAPLGVATDGRPVTEATLFQVGSITKTQVALAILRLVEAGRLRLDEPVRNVLPSLLLADEHAARRVTIRHLLTHTGGWAGDCEPDADEGDGALERMVGSFGRSPWQTPPGEVWAYSNAGYNVLGRVIEVLTGRTFEESVGGLVWDPLGIEGSFVRSTRRPTDNHAAGHFSAGTTTVIAQPWSLGRAMNPAGGWICDVRNLLRYARYFFGEGGPLLERAGFAEMLTPQIASTGHWKMGLGWNISDAGGFRMIGHGGATMGQVALLRIVPARKFAVAVMANHGEAGGFCMKLADAAIERFLGLRLPAWVEMAVGPEFLASCVGNFGPYQVAARDGWLEIRLPEGETVSAAFHSREGFFVRDGPMAGATGEFLFAGGGWMRFAGRLHARTT